MIIGVTKKRVANEDLLTAIAKKQYWIEKGEKVEIFDTINNCYGRFYLLRPLSGIGEK